VADGVNVTLIGQVLPAARDDPQVLVCEKSPEFPPAMLMPVIVSDAVPVFERVTVCAELVVLTTWLPNESDDGETPATGPHPLISGCG
jgi:hypothetical protein